MKKSQARNVIAFLILFLFQTGYAYSQDTTSLLKPPAGYIATMESREASNGHIVYLKKYYSQCIIKDTTTKTDSIIGNCTQFKNVTKLNLPYENRMADLSWIKYFDNLEELTVQFNFITILPDTFPAKLKKLDLTYNNIKTNDTLPFSVLPKGLTYLNVSYQREGLKVLPNLPDSLKVLEASNNSIKLLPTIIPSKIVKINVQRNQITALPASLATSTIQYLDASMNQIAHIDNMSASLVSLNLSYNKITSITSSNFPVKLENIQLQGNKLTSLPPFNAVVDTVDVSQNNLIAIPNLPATVKNLNVGNNLLVSLPTLPMALITLSANDNVLESLPVLPLSLSSLNVSKNKIAVLPTLPASLLSLYASSNLLTSLPQLPSNLKQLIVANNSISVLPTLPTSINGLNISQNTFSGILTGLPITIEYLECDNNSLTSINLSLPSSLKKVSFSGNNLTAFPFATIPLTLSELYCDSNAIVSIPTLPDNLYYLRAAGNVFTCLPNLPEKLSYTDIRNICNKNSFLKKDGNWGDPLNWSFGSVPTATTDAFILNANVRLDVNARVKNLELRSSLLNARTDTAKVLVVRGNIKGSFICEVEMAGSVNQQILDNCYFKKLTINNASGVKLGYSCQIDELSVPQGFLIGYNGPINIVKLGYCHSGTVVKDATLQVNIYSKVGWTFLSNNIINEKFSYLNNYIELGFGGSNQNVYAYNGDIKAKNGWVPISATSDPFVAGAGYRVYSYRSSLVEYNGLPFTGPKNYNVTYTATGYDGGGWNLVGNPYMSPINWDESAGWNKTNIDNAVYIWNSNAGKYASYVNGAETNGGTKEIAIGQSFFVKANGVNPNLTINEFAKVKEFYSSVALFRQAETPSLKIILTDTKKNTDEILLRVVNGSTADFDSDYDAYKLAGEGHNISISGTDKVPLSISSIPLSEGSFPLEIAANKTGKYTFSFEGIEKFDATTDVYLSDTYLNKTTLIEEGTRYPFSLDTKTDPTRFKIVFSNLATGYQDAVKSATLKVYPNPTKDNATVVFPTQVSGELILTDISGDIVYTNTLTNSDSIILPLENYKGVYILKVYTGESILVTKIIKL